MTFNSPHSPKSNVEFISKNLALSSSILRVFQNNIGWEGERGGEI